MSPTEFAQCRRTLGLTQRELARLLRLRPGGDRSIRHYEQGTKPVPGPVSVVLEMLCDDYDPMRAHHAAAEKALKWLEGDAKVTPHKTPFLGDA